MPPQLDEPDDALSLAEELRPVLQRLLRQIRRESDTADVSLFQKLLLANIVQQPGIGVGELARLENLRGPTVSGHIKALLAMGLVTRGTPNEDRRRVGLVATPQGQELIASMRTQRTNWLAERLRGLSPEARQAIRNALQPLTEITR
jgi:DNA-binding MarR family transcriptional regulator